MIGSKKPAPLLGLADGELLVPLPPVGVDPEDPEVEPEPDPPEVAVLVPLGTVLLPPLPPETPPLGDAEPEPPEAIGTRVVPLTAAGTP